DWARQLGAAGKAKDRERQARLHVWLGEYKLARLENPDAARWHFAQAVVVCRGHTTRHTIAELRGRAPHDSAIARSRHGAYADATQRFRVLVNAKTAQPGYSRRECALWQRHAGACWGYHVKRQDAGITEPTRIDPYCGAASLARCLKALGMKSDKASLQGV